MDSALRPREIQTRIRAGQGLDEVARDAGVPVEKIEPYAVPVLAERAHVAVVALTSSVRRRGETHGHRTLRQVVAERLLGRGIDADSVDWDAWRGEDRRWTVRGAYNSGSAHREALFLFDMAGRFSTSVNDDARWLVGEPSPSTGPQPGRRAHQYDDSDELALVRAISDADDEVTLALPDSLATEPSPAEPSPAERADFPSAGPEESMPPGRDDATQRGPGAGELSADASPFNSPRSAATPQQIGEEVEAELDASDVIPEGRSELDLLYDMLGGINEDSINIYAGLDQPVIDDEPRPATTGAEPSQADAPTTHTEEPTQRPPAQDVIAAEEPHQPSLEEEFGEPTRRIPRQEVAPTARPRDGQPDSNPAADQAQSAGEAPAEKPKAARRSRKKRASVPSWDEIMFGGPQPPKNPPQG